jgi:uncharacterized protein
MRVVDDVLVVSPSDLSNFLSCRHRAGLDLAAAHQQLVRPTSDDPYAALLQKHGEEHERAYVEALRAQGKQIVDLADYKNDPDAAGKTRVAMRAGADVIVQAKLESDALAGYADILLKVNAPSALGGWSYEVQDTKLARETKGGTILQLCAYSAMVADIQGAWPHSCQVVTPGPDGQFAVQGYRIADYAAYYRMVLSTLRRELATGHEALIADHYPDPVEACAFCVWEAQCEKRRRADDHLCYVAGLGRVHQVELTNQGHATLAAAATMPVPVTFKPARGASETYTRLGHQARVQHEQRTSKTPVFEMLPILEKEGLCRLPEPSAGDMFLDLEGARFARDGGREYLFGVWSRGSYRAWWAVNDVEEQAVFEAVIDFIIAEWAACPDMHVYHFNHYEPTALKKLMGRYATRGPELDRLLRAERFVDLFPIARQAVRAGVESYSIKQLEQYTGYTRNVSLPDARGPLVAIEVALDANMSSAITPEIKQAVAGYNEDDCRSTEVLRDWLEGLRAKAIAEGAAISRPTVEADEERPVPPVQQKALAVRERLLANIPVEASEPPHPAHPTWLLAYLVDWHRREVNAEWWEFFRLLAVPEDDLFDERKAVAGLQFVGQVDIVRNKKTGNPTGSVINRYTYPPQEIEVGGKLTCKDGSAFGEIVAHDRQARLLDVQQGKSVAHVRPSCALANDVVTNEGQQESVIRFAERVMAGNDECGAELLHRRSPRLRSRAFEKQTGETDQDFAVRIATDLNRTTLPIQGPPGAGKTYIGAQMIRALVRADCKVGVVGPSHKVVRNLLDEVVQQAVKGGEVVNVGAKPGERSEQPGVIFETTDNKGAFAAITSGQVQVFGGTAFLWAREEFAKTVDVLFVDEAGQMSLANVLAVSQAAESVVLLGDPKQLDQPEKATHPDGVGVSSLDHVLGDADTIPADRGIFLPITWRMSPTLTAFTSELFYDSKLTSKDGLEAQQILGTGRYDGSRLWLVPVAHDGNQSASVEEVDAVESLVRRLLASGAQWIGASGVPQPLTGDHLRVVAPFNAQVNRLAERLAPFNVPVGTVDKFQGQTAAVVIYSMATSRPEDAPRGMEFLYSVNRLNVATSRARCAVFLVASPRLFEPDCRTPRQMLLASAMCRFREMAASQEAM